MTKRQLKALEALPDVIDALTSLADDAERLRAAMAKAAGLGVLPTPQPRPRAPVPVEAPRPMMLPTPERAEYMEQLKNPQPYEPEAEEPGYKKRQREFMQSLRQDPRRSEKLKQFEGEAPNGHPPD